MSIDLDMSEEENKEIVAEFLMECGQYIKILSMYLLKAKEALNGSSPLSPDELYTMFRAAHTIKGSSSMLGFDNLIHISKGMEAILDHVREGRLALTMPVIELLFTAIDALNGLLKKLSVDGHDDKDVAEVVNKLNLVLSSNIPQSAPTS